MSKILAALMASCLALAAAPANAAAVNGWSVQQTGAACSMQARFEGGASLAFILWPQGKVEIMVTASAWRFGERTTYQNATFRFEHLLSDRPPSTFTVDTGAWQLDQGAILSATLPADALDALGVSGKFFIDVSVSGRRFSEGYATRTPALAVQELRKCAKDIR